MQFQLFRTYTFAMPFDIRNVCGEIKVPKQEFHGNKLEYTKRNQVIIFQIHASDSVKFIGFLIL